MNIIITGSSRGIGAAIARQLAAPGRHIVVNYLVSEVAAERVAAEVRELGAEATVVQGDVRVEADLERLARSFEGVDKIRTSQWDLTMESSLRPFWLLTRMCKFNDGANVIGLSSMGSQRHVPGYAAMGAAKAGMEALTRQLAVDLAPRVRVNTVCGGVIRTDALNYFPEQGARMIELAEKLTPMGRCGEPEDLARLVDLLIDPRAYWLTGQVLVADGGMSLR
jgi:NAD(P)-dependent dehydrogenase (short-subunit alcohol dehydrogenase family)